MTPLFEISFVEREDGRQASADPSEAARTEACPDCQRLFGCECDEVAAAVDAPSEPEGGRQ